MWIQIEALRGPTRGNTRLGSREAPLGLGLGSLGKIVSLVRSRSTGFTGFTEFTGSMMLLILNLGSEIRIPQSPSSIFTSGFRLQASATTSSVSTLYKRRDT